MNEMTNKAEAITGNNEKDAGVLKIEANVRPIEPRNNLLAFASVKIADCFVVDNIKIVAGEKGLMVDMPSIKGSDGKYHDIAFPITAGFRRQINSAILDGFTAAVDRVRNIGAAQREYTEKPSIKEQLHAGAEKGAKDTASRPAKNMGAKHNGVEMA